MASTTNLTQLPLELVHCGLTWHDYLWPWVSLTWLLYYLQFWKFTVWFRPIRKKTMSSLYNNDSYYTQLLNGVGQPSLFNGHVHNILTLVYKSLNGLVPEYITNMFSYQTHSINLRTSGTCSLAILRVNTIAYGLHSLSYFGSKLWNLLPSTIRSLPMVAAFKSAIHNLEFDTGCCTFC